MRMNKITYNYKVHLIFLKVGVCRNQLFSNTSTEAVADPPIPKSDWRDKCTAILGRKVGH